MTQPGYKIDIMATSLDAACDEYPSAFRGRQPSPMEGKSLVPILHGQRRTGHEIMAWNCSRGREIRTGQWKLVRHRDEPDREPYEISADGGEIRNLASSFPLRAQKMSEQYETWRQRVGAK
jgi:arylsulfatase A-like enzyme